MILLALSAAFVGFVHSLSPAHWVPVVLITRARRWPAGKAAMGALSVAGGHIVISVAIGLTAAFLGMGAIAAHEESVERYTALGLVVFGGGYAAYMRRKHRHCHGHTHHGPDFRRERHPFYVLFLLGFSPCLAVLPIFVAAAPGGPLAVLLAAFAFIVGVLGALVPATVLVSKGLLKLDHPFLEHNGDVIAGLGILVTGLALFLLG